MKRGEVSTIELKGGWTRAEYKRKMERRYKKVSFIWLDVCTESPVIDRTTEKRMEK